MLYSFEKITYDHLNRRGISWPTPLIFAEQGLGPTALQENIIMRKVVVFVSLLLVGTGSAFAYYPDEYDAGPSGWTVLFALLYFAVGVLNVILFFKIWRMTDDVKSLKNTIQKNDTSAANITREELLARVRKLYFTGNADMAYSIINSYVFSLLKILINMSLTDKDQKRVIYTNDWDTETQSPITKPLDKAISEELSRNEKLYELIGKEMPSCLKDFTYEQYAAFSSSEAK